MIKSSHDVQMQQASNSEPFARNKSDSYNSDVFGQVLRDFDIWGYGSINNNSLAFDSAKEFAFEADEWTLATESTTSTGHSSLDLLDDVMDELASKQSVPACCIDNVKKPVAVKSSSQSMEDEESSRASGTVVSKSVVRRMSARKESRSRRLHRHAHIRKSLETQLAGLAEKSQLVSSKEESTRRRPIERTTSSISSSKSHRRPPNRRDTLERSASMIMNRSQNSPRPGGSKHEPAFGLRKKLQRSISAKNLSSLEPCKPLSSKSLGLTDDSLISPQPKKPSSSRRQRSRKNNSLLNRSDHGSVDTYSSGQ